jgi:peptide/nickel transport system substrate-binding protein
VVQNVYPGLIGYAGSSITQFDPVLAANYTESPNATTYVFNIRPGLEFSDGQPVDAYSVWFEYYRITINNGPPGYILGPVTSGGPFLPGNVSVSDLNNFNFTSPTASQLAVMEASNQSIQVLGQYSVAINLLSGPMPSLLWRLAGPAGGLLDPNFVQTHGGVQINSTENTYISQNGGPGAGPFEVKSWVQGQAITLVNNPLYWGSKPHLTTVILRYLSVATNAISDLKSGAAQMVFNIPFNELTGVTGTAGITLENAGLSIDIGYLGINTQMYPLNITAVRLAINYAINKTQIIDSVLGGYGQPFQGPVPDGMIGHNNSITPIGYNLTYAEQLLTQAGFPGGKGIPALTMEYYTGDPVVADVMQTIESDLTQLGLSINLQGVASTPYFTMLETLPRTASYPALLWGDWFPDYAFPDDYAYNIDNPNSVWNIANLNNTQITDLTNEALTANSTASINQDYSQVMSLDKNLSGTVWLFQLQDGYGVPAYLSTVHGVTWNPMLYGFNYSSIYLSS